MTASLFFCLAQLNPIVGDIAGNLAKLRDARAIATAQKADLLILPELFLCGYPPEDLIVKPSFLNAVQQAIETLATDTADGGPAILIGTPWREAGKTYNAALLLEAGHVAARVFKNNLPAYGPFDEKRLFYAADGCHPVMFRGNPLGIVICEDMWTADVACSLRDQGAGLLIILNASPYETGKAQQRRQLAAARVRETGLPLVYVNQIGGQDELVFDGGSFALDGQGACVMHMQRWQEQTSFMIFAEGKIQPDVVHETSSAAIADMYQALVLGLRDYMSKNGFKSVLLGLSGGVDSALAAILAVDALGADNVRAVMMPSPYTAQQSLDDAQAVADGLGVRLDTVPIDPAMQMLGEMIAPVVKVEGVTAENIQSRSRGLILMALSNASGSLVLATGNKSEMAVGYATLYGDMCGGFAVLKDIYKTKVYELCRWRNSHLPTGALGPEAPVIPQSILTRPPSAELRPDQTDQDSLPPYDVLDGILECLIEDDLGLRATAARGFAAKTVQKVWNLLDQAEYKRRQAPPGVKVTRRMLGRDRRYPMTNKYHEDL